MIICSSWFFCPPYMLHPLCVKGLHVLCLLLVCFDMFRSSFSPPCNSSENWLALSLWCVCVLVCVMRGCVNLSNMCVSLWSMLWVAPFFQCVFVWNMCVCSPVCAFIKEDRRINIYHLCFSTRPPYTTASPIRFPCKIPAHSFFFSFFFFFMSALEFSHGLF